MLSRDNIPPWLQPAWERLLQLTDSPPAALMLGSADTHDGDALACLWSRALLCEQAVDANCAGSCRSCREIEAGVHPDYRVIEKATDKREIGIDQIREATQWAAQTARGRHRVLYIRFAEQMGHPAANALLKTLEEPVASLTILLSVRRVEALPVTVRSRCLRLQLPVPDADSIRPWLEQQGLRGSTLDQALSLHPNDVTLAGAVNEETQATAQRYQQAWSIGWEQGDALAAAKLLDQDDWAQAIVWLQRKVVETMSSQGSAGLASVWDALILLRRGERFAFNRLLLLEELFMLLRRAKSTG